MKTILYIILGALAILLYFNGKVYWYKLFPVKETYGTAYNPERSKRKLMTLPHSWKAKDSSDTHIIWSSADTVFDSDTGYRKSKSVTLRDHQITLEEDRVVHFLKDSAFREELLISYAYDSLLPWNITYIKSSDTTGPLKLSKKEGDSLMRIWNVRRHVE
ncbi:hypothetical protein [uncultured Chitinophaga sp.]|uniref:hypothetical protein n=1 Tax=uncultured Chitinophaga sp. TaxID=339340 RepID=UPI0025D142B7|nr:hypothetical protein [uncultured Chitinophaga sp.]